jgi:hypothetical protein
LIISFSFFFLFRASLYSTQQIIIVIEFDRVTTQSFRLLNQSFLQPLIYQSDNLSNKSKNGTASNNPVEYGTAQHEWDGEEDIQNCDF